MSFSAGWCLQAPLLWPCRSMRQHARAREAPQHPIALSQQLHTHVVLRARRLLTALRRYVADGARAWTCATAWPPWNSRAWLCAAQQSAYGALAGRAKNAPHELPIEEVWWIWWTDALWLAQQLAPVGARTGRAPVSLFNRSSYQGLSEFSATRFEPCTAFLVTCVAQP